MANVTGIFSDRPSAERAVTALMENGLEQDEISLLMSDEARRVFFGNEDVDARAAKAGVAGAGIGGVLGALIAGLTAVGTIAIPGGVLMAGPVVAALSGAGAGALVGGFGAALVRAGIDESEADDYEAALNAGKVVVIAHADDEQEEAAARQAFRRVQQLAA